MSITVDTMISQQFESWCQREAWVVISKALDDQANNAAWFDITKEEWSLRGFAKKFNHKVFDISAT